MPTAAALRLQIETALAQKIPSALTPSPRLVRPVVSTGIPALDNALHGGFPLGGVTEIVGPESSGRTAVALSFLARIIRQRNVCAWVDGTNSFDAESAAAAGLDLERLLLIRCGAIHSTSPCTTTPPFRLPPGHAVAAPAKRGLHGGGFGPHPRSEANGLADAVDDLLQSSANRATSATSPHLHPEQTASQDAPIPLKPNPPKPLSRIEQALRVTDLLLQVGGFGAIVLDLAGIAPEVVSRIPAATWFRYRAAAEKTQASIVLLTRHPCAQSSAALVLRMHPCEPRKDLPTLFSGLIHRIEIVRQRFAPAAPGCIVPLRKPAQSERAGTWKSQPTWMGCR